MGVYFIEASRMQQGMLHRVWDWEHVSLRKKNLSCIV